MKINYSSGNNPLKRKYFNTDGGGYIIEMGFEFYKEMEYKLDFR